ncbi:hypothetical protein GC176_02535 [bacterium]|nr:hypothetical protein [bacterium]
MFNRIQTASAIGLCAVLSFCLAGSPVFADGRPDWSYDTYDYTETVERGDIKQYRLAIPKGVTTVKGILVVSNCFGGDSRDWYKDGTAYESFINMHDFAFIGGKLDCSHYEAYDAFVKALAVWAKESGHAELVNAPYLATGVSAGGGFASTLVTKCPEKTIGVVIVCARLNLTVFELKKYDENNPVPVPEAVIRTPVLNITGETEYAATVIEPPMETWRPHGALYGWAESPGRGHEYNGQERLAMPYLDAVLKQRYPSDGDVRKAPLKLKDPAPETAWTADDTTWKSGLTAIGPSQEFNGDIGKSSWLPDKDIAFIYRAYATYGRKLKLTSPLQDNIYTRICEPGSSVVISVDTSQFPDWTKLEFYDGSTLLGTVTSGATQFTATNLTPGFHTFSVLGTDSAGKVTTSDCGMIAVHKTNTPASGNPASDSRSVPKSATRESFTGTASRSGTFKRPLLDVNGTRYELEASATADGSVQKLLKKFSEGDTGTYVIKGVQATVNGKDGIIIDSITPSDVVAGAGQKNLTVLKGFAGDKGPGTKALPDNVGGVGNEHVVDFTTAHFVVHDKQTGRMLQEKTQTEFWAELGFPGIAKPNDPRMLYDPLTERWIATIANDAEHKLFLAVSTTPDPLKPWKATLTPFESPDFGFRMGVDRNGFYGCWWNYNQDTHTMMTACALPKDDLIAAAGPDFANVQIFRDLEIESFPATDTDPNKAPDAPAILLNRQFGNSFDKLCMYRITWSGRRASISELQTIPLSREYFAPNATSHKMSAAQPAPGSRLRGDEARRTTCVYTHNGSVFTCNGAKRSLESRCGIFWCEVRVSDGAVLQEGLVDDDTCDYVIPTLAVDAHGNVGLGCTRSSETEFPSAYVMVHGVNDKPGTMRPAVLAVKGTTIYSPDGEFPHGVPWGNYNSTCIDPTDGLTFWTTQQYAIYDTPGQWSTCWAAFMAE